MFPYRDDNPTILTPYATIGLIVANVLVWVVVQGMGMEPSLSRSVCQLGLIAGEFFHQAAPGTSVPLGPGVECVIGQTPTWYTPLTSMFLHGGWLHLLGNIWFLWVFGNNIEDSMGHGRFVAFYLLCGLIAGATQAFISPASLIPMVGASGAISGVMGGYIVLYPRVRVHMLVFLFIFITRITVPAWVMLGYWFLLQLLGGIPMLAAESGGVAFWAHAGGFVAGMLLIWLFRRQALVARRVRVVAPYGAY